MDDFKACRDCKHLWQTHCGCSDYCACGTGVKCSARHGVSNLRSFPFKKTDCDKFCQKVVREVARDPLSGEMLMTAREASKMTKETQVDKRTGKG